MTFPVKAVIFDWAGTMVDFGCKAPVHALTSVFAGEGVPISEAEAREAALLFDALSDPVRLRIFSIIASEDEVCSCNLEAPVAKSQPTISHHTRILAGVGLIVGERRGRWTYWRAVPERLALARNLLSA